ncbi:penicillin-binding transpeptidase domain-containing protein [Rhodohalobacter sulfatireducens]|uniref:Beta-lactamase n=1 Tax=Rhodohalobacter sulfatireducens TaxID=2911366 RepID=A0ABS9KHN3_9BACT|nr:penicillin-binding transpeptidase domain-containing protein [Rhodohalobacter sulfatireducens]MCG2590364.1 PASTA domain-containing protein [Rhodohalobacter sulfatireducens]
MSDRSSIMSRMFLLFGFLLLLPAGIFFQLLRVNVAEGDGLRELWNSQAIDYVSIPAERGDIYDATGSILATNQVIYQVAVDPKTVGRTSQDIQRIAETLSNHTSRNVNYYKRKIQNAPSRSQYVVLEKSVPVQAYEDLNLLDIRGLLLEEEYRRNYNFGSLAAHVVGFVNHEMKGMAGLESEYDDILKGTDGLQQVRKDPLNNIFAYVGAPRKQPEQGYSLHTTINSQIQAIVEEELEAGIERHMADKGTAIIMDPKTGAIQAMANFPYFNPNSPATIENENRRNYAISDQIEPGSTFKVATAIAAIEQELVGFDEKFETPEKGYKMIHGQTMRDHDPLGTLTFSEVISKSSNIATSEIAMRMEPESFYQYARNLGFGTSTQIDLPGEKEGRLQRPYEWSLVTLPWMSIGYEVQVTPMQMIQAYAAVANDGVMMKPYVVESVRDEFGNILQQRKPVSVRKVADEETIDKLIPILEDVVSDSGTASWAMVEGLRIAGKTGTAQKFKDGQYQTKYRASFVGFFPVEDPEHAIFILLDEPKTSIYGGFTAGSIFKEIATRISGLDNSIQKSTPKDMIAEDAPNVAPKLTGLQFENASILLNKNGIPFKKIGEGIFVEEQIPAPGEKIDPNKPLEIKLTNQTTDSIPEGYAQIPDLTNLNMRQATFLLMSRGFEIETVGSGTVYTQFPRAGDLMKKGRTVTVRGKAKSISQSQSIASY